VETVIHHRHELVLYSLRNIEPMKVDMHNLYKLSERSTLLSASFDVSKLALEQVESATVVRAVPGWWYMLYHYQLAYCVEKRSQLFFALHQSCHGCYPCV